MDNALKGLILAAGVVLTCMVIGIGFYIAREAKATAAISTDRLSQVQTDLKESELTKYDGIKVSGSDVRNFIKKQVGRCSETEVAAVTIVVTTSKGTFSFVNTKYFLDMRTEENQRYINPIDTFLGSVVRDENDVITKVSFTKQ